MYQRPAGSSRIVVSSRERSSTAARPRPGARDCRVASSRPVRPDQAARQPPISGLNSSQMSIRWLLPDVSSAPSSFAKISSGGKTAGFAEDRRVDELLRLVVRRAVAVVVRLLGLDLGRWMKSSHAYERSGAARRRACTHVSSQNSVPSLGTTYPASFVSSVGEDLDQRAGPAEGDGRLFGRPACRRTCRSRARGCAERRRAGPGGRPRAPPSVHRVERVALHLEREHHHVAHRVDEDGLARCPRP